MKRRLVLLCVSALLAVSCGASAPDQLKDVTGKQVPPEVASIYRGEKHCDEPRVTYIELGDKQYIGDPHKESFFETARTGYADRVAVPADAKDTGYHSGKLHLFVAADGMALYLVRGDGKTAKRLPKTPYQFNCK